MVSHVIHVQLVACTAHTARFATSSDRCMLPLKTVTHNRLHSWRIICQPCKSCTCLTMTSVTYSQSCKNLKQLNIQLQLNHYCCYSPWHLQQIRAIVSSAEMPAPLTSSQHSVILLVHESVLLYAVVQLLAMVAARCLRVSVTSITEYLHMLHQSMTAHFANCADH
eukprot:6513-Heterococcus_DN1.PRE.3